MKRIEPDFRVLHRQILEGQPTESQLRLLFDYLNDHIDVVDATHHPLGFLHVNVGNFEGQGLRLHIWAAEFNFPVRPLWPIHNHTFDVVSYVSAGIISNVMYEVENADARAATNRVYFVEYTNNTSTLRATKDLVRIVNMNESTTVRGEIYRVHRGRFHASTSKAGFSCTVVCTVNNLEPVPLVLGDLRGSPVYENARRRCESSTVERLLIKARNESFG
jgi:hypothetical protein